MAHGWNGWHQRWKGIFAHSAARHVCKKHRRDQRHQKQIMRATTMISMMPVDWACDAIWRSMVVASMSMFWRWRRHARRPKVVSGMPGSRQAVAGTLNVEAPDPGHKKHRSTVPSKQEALLGQTAKKNINAVSPGTSVCTKVVRIAVNM